MDANHDGDDEKDQLPCTVCENCKTLGVQFRNADSVRAEYDEESTESKCRSWLERCTINTSDGESVYSSETSSTHDLAVSETTQDDESDFSENNAVGFQDKVVCVSGQENSGAVEGLLNKSNQYGEVRMRKCNKVHLGNVTKIYGPVHVTQTVSTFNQQSVTNQIFLEGAAVPVRSANLSLVNRTNWLAQPPVEERRYLDAPAKFVIISHTASEEGYTQAENVLLVRLTQTFHIESRKWADIAYNFLVGCDGNVYEGRGWGVVGAHTFGYNNIGIGISFVGCFMNRLPSQGALNQAKTLIKHGVEIGAIDKNYSLVGHCQCCPTESPGKRLFEEIQTWDHWDSMDDKEKDFSE